MDAYTAHRLALQGNTMALAAWEEFGVHLGAVVKTIMYTYDPEAIVFGGSITKASGLFTKSMLASLKDFAYPRSISNLTLLLSENENIALLGAAALMEKA